MIQSKRETICQIIEKLGKHYAAQDERKKKTKNEKPPIDEIIDDDMETRKSSDQQNCVKKPRLSMDNEATARVKVLNSRLADLKSTKHLESNRNKNIIIDDIENL